MDATASARKWSRRAGLSCERKPARGRAALLRTAKPCGPDTRCWCQVVGGEFVPTGYECAVKPAATVTTRIRSPGRARHKPSSHCAGNAGVFPLNLYARVRILDAHFAHETAGAARTRHSLLPPLREKRHEQLGRLAPRDRAVVFSGHRPRMRTIQHSRGGSD